MRKFVPSTAFKLFEKTSLAIAITTLACIFLVWLWRVTASHTIESTFSAEGRVVDFYVPIDSRRGRSHFVVELSGGRKTQVYRSDIPIEHTFRGVVKLKALAHPYKDDVRFKIVEIKME